MGKEVEVGFKIRMTKEEAEKVLDKIFDRELWYTTNIKTDKYWSSSDGKTREEGKEFRIRSVHYMSDKEIAYFSEKGDINVKTWFFYDSEKMFAKHEIEKWEDNESENLLDYSTLSYKQKKIEDGVENNEEYKKQITRSQAILLNKVFNNISKKYFSKVKRCLSIESDPAIIQRGNFGIIIDISNVKDNFYFEIEGVAETDDFDAKNKVKRVLEEFVSDFGLDPKKKDLRNWIEILIKGN